MLGSRKTSCGRKGFSWESKSKNSIRSSRSQGLDMEKPRAERTQLGHVIWGSVQRSQGENSLEDQQRKEIYIPTSSRNYKDQRVLDICLLL